jgi:hypothetical protein
MLCSHQINIVVPDIGDAIDRGKEGAYKGIRDLVNDVSKESRPWLGFNLIGNNNEENKEYNNKEKR